MTVVVSWKTGVKATLGRIVLFTADWFMSKRNASFFQVGGESDLPSLKEHLLSTSPTS